MKIIETPFPPSHTLHKIFNRNTVKISYRCMPNMKQTLCMHNTKLNNVNQENEDPPGCNCRRGLVCPLNGQCLTKGVVYEATVEREDDRRKETYTGLTARTFKKRHYGHTSSFRHEKNKGESTLSGYIWELKNDHVPFNIKWDIICKSSDFNPITRTCRLCLKEKYFIMFRPEGATLNDRREFYTPCRHRWKQLLSHS